MAWFARFFTDTLVQVSLVSINSCFQVGIFLGCGWLIRYGRAYEVRTDALSCILWCVMMCDRWA
jgi:hypothetical protein